MTAIPEWVRSALLTFAVTFALTLAAGPDLSQATIVAAVAAAARTALSGVLPGGSFGKTPIGSGETGDE